MPVTASRSEGPRRSAPRRRSGRLLLGTALSTAVTGVVLAAPVVSTGSETTPTALDSSSSTATRFAEQSSPVVMGRDGLDPSSPAAIVPSPAAVVPAATAVVPPPSAVVPPPAAEAPVTAPAEVDTTPMASSAAPETTTEAPASAAPAPSVATAAGATGATGAVAPDLERAVLALVNAARAAAGCGALVHDEGLAGVARAHSADMRDRRSFDHGDADGRDPFDRAEAAGQTNARAENIAHGQPDPAAAMETWMAGSDHRANILDCELRTLGVGVAEGAGGPWWTQLFGD